MPVGTLENFNGDFGFLSQHYPPHVDNIFVHRVALEQAGVVAPTTGQVFDFEITLVDGKRRATNLRRLLRWNETEPKPAEPVGRGVITRWLEDRAYGFLRDEGGATVFIRLKELRCAGIHRPEVGMKLKYETTERNGKPAATNVRLAN